ncbi:hypothetical protein COY13_03485 [Candidatus Roizmanbacteria bacterium CG_4_10_14_0_2_um_filter_36_35]|uniref:HD domain-containing protein n=4 Tax=Candidatus Roizmaniibacteriota TaxID=1752723 RepID=A0A2M7BXU5_9BACT|nr:MAG: hypothetical protein COV86_02700 [Candidatus Roizmanbacteria bacterium CG11_big_fil_rev_8_21_14_0_20_35_14]PIV11378.1 MAG: hypothetical protein COS50_00575 [Candidatus Roizmanbacteria bacterium CG03_land_8_20_14_0_80_35_26]PIZ67296.1 MAG: hypothetical protein COY13_03485 [Candidatus Roizmanbacteria bacterium CG_4_10_14_0_2_um_filter_36_35]PJC33335.1 MAG: hypothetical protein CO049_00710 [Candidatus Roizmanbacteria bacterium CG_4_9_14_0_2_um_filter_36_12]PJC79953.1 MAG: hypothetical prot
MNILHLAIQMNLSKKLKRSGWIRENIKDPESLAEHCFTITVLITILSKYLGVSEEKLIRMAIVHNFSALLTEDFVVERGKKIFKRLQKKKEKIEKEAIRTIFWDYDMNYSNLYNEMVQRKSKESIIFWQIDKLATTIQAYDYEKEQNKSLSEFFENARIYIKEPLLKKAFEDLKKMRKSFK